MRDDGASFVYIEQLFELGRVDINVLSNFSDVIYLAIRNHILGRHDIQAGMICL